VADAPGHRGTGCQAAQQQAGAGYRTSSNLLRGITIDLPDQVWGGRHQLLVGRGFYLVATIDWARRAVLSWRLPNTMHVSFCVAALRKALLRFGKPQNTDPVAPPRVQYKSLAPTNRSSHVSALLHETDVPARSLQFTRALDVVALPRLASVRLL
jgi:transposase InsO family protein